MQKRRNILIFGSVAFAFLLFGLKTSFGNVKALVVRNNTETVQTALGETDILAEGQQPGDMIKNDAARNEDTYSRGGADDRSLGLQEAELDTDTHANTVDSKLRIGDSGEEIKKLQENLKKMGFFNEEPTGFFGIVTNDAVVDFQVQMGIMPDGIVGTDTLKKVEEAISQGVVAKKKPVQETSKPAPAKQQAQPKQEQSKQPSQAQSNQQSSQQQEVSKGGKAELLSWFGGAENVFSIGSVAKVIDVDTGISFSVKRTYGYNHADVETMTAGDTETLKKIAGGFNWTRRAIIVEVNGRRLAASMAPMPHAGLDSKPANAQVSGRSGGYGTGDNLDTVKGNAMDGHFDIHFYNSRTHGSNKVDSNHQAMVQKAYRSGK